MNILYYNFVSLIIIQIICWTLKKINKGAFFDKLYVIIITIQLIIINGFRHPLIGVDTNRYNRHFLNVAKISSFPNLIKYDQEIGYVLYQKIISMFTDNFQLFLIISAIGIFVPLGFIIYKYSTNIFLSYFIFITMGYFDFSMSGIRQSLAMSLCLLSVHFIINKKPMMFFITVLIATSIHYTALITLVFYFIYHFKLGKINFIVIIISYLTLFLLRYRIGALFSQIYYDDSKLLLGYSTSTGIGTVATILLLLLFFGWLTHNPIRNTNKKILGYYNIMIVAFSLQTLSSYSYLFTRLAMFYTQVLILFIPEIITTKSEVKVIKETEIVGLSKLILYILLIIVLSIYYLNQISSNTSQLLPFKFYWQ